MTARRVTCTRNAQPDTHSSDLQREYSLISPLALSAAFANAVSLVIEMGLLPLVNDSLNRATMIATSGRVASADRMSASLAESKEIIPASRVASPTTTCRESVRVPHSDRKAGRIELRIRYPTEVGAAEAQ